MIGRPLVGQVAENYGRARLQVAVRKVRYGQGILSINVDMFYGFEHEFW